MFDDNPEAIMPTSPIRNARDRVHNRLDSLENAAYVLIDRIELILGPSQTIGKVEMMARDATTPDTSQIAAGLNDMADRIDSVIGILERATVRVEL